MPGPMQRWKLAAGNFLVTWAALMLALAVLWLLLAWLGRKFVEVNFGLGSPAGPWVLGIGVPLIAVFAVLSTVRWVRAWRDIRPALREDIEHGTVVEEHYTFAAAKRFQEPEHGGLLYFLHSANERALVLYDHESQNLGVQGADPLSSSFVPRAELVMVRAPHTRFVLGKEFSGPELKAGAPKELTAPPSEWPEQDEYCKYGWGELEARLAGAEK